MKIRIAIFLCLLCAFSASATVLYVTQNGVAPFTLTNSIAGFNANTNLQQTNVFTGTLTSPVTLQSGTVSSNMNYWFATNAKFSAPTWPNDGNNYFDAGKNHPILGGSLQYVVIDGCANGIIEATANGWQQTWSNNFDGIAIAVGVGVEIRNLTMRNFNPRSSNNVDNTCAPEGIYAAGTMTGLSIHNNNFTNMGNCILVVPQTGVSTNCSVFSNNCFGCSWGIYSEAGSINALNYNERIWRNRVDNGTGWDAIKPGPFHNDGIIVGAPFNGATNYGMKIYWNIVGPNSGYDTTTSALYWETTLSAPFNQNGLVFGNIFLCAGFGQQWNSGIINLNGSGFGVYNNTFESLQYDVQTDIALSGGDGSIAPVLLNNLFKWPDTAIYPGTENVTSIVPTNGFNFVDWNYFSVGGSHDHGFGIPGLNGTCSWDIWTNSYVYPPFLGTNNQQRYVDPSYNLGNLLPSGFPPDVIFGSSYMLTADTNNAIYVVGRGTNLTTLATQLGVPELTIDINGVQRPASGPWTIGAQEGSSTNVTADFTGTPLAGTASLPVTFTDASINATNWSWTFGDAGTSTAQNPVHTYTSAGTYTVALTILGLGAQSNTKTRTSYIVVSAPGSTYTLTVNNGTGSASGLTAGQVVTIGPSCTIWSGWTGPGVSFIAGQTATTTLTMPAANTSITANCTNAPSGGGANGGYSPWRKN